MLFEKKIYKKNYPVVSGEGNPETILFLIEEKDILYIPEYSKEYSFPKDTEVYEIILGQREENISKPENMASPFILTGDACFYNFMARKIKVSGEQELFNKKGKDLVWLTTGSLYLEIEEKEKIRLTDLPIVINEEGLVYKLIGQGEVFLLKI